MDSPTNLLAAQKVDPAVASIMTTAPSVAIYKFCEAKKCWVKSDHEGALLVCKRNQEPNCCVIILNQLKPQNFVQYMTSGMSLQRKSEYLLYRSSQTDVVQAIWFYNQGDCARIYELLKMITGQKTDEPPNAQPILAAGIAGKTPTKETPTETSGRPKDIMNILSTAQKNFGHQAPRAQGQSAGQERSNTDQVTNVGPGSDGFPSHRSSSSIQVANLFKPHGTDSNGASAAVQRAGATSDIPGKEPIATIGQGVGFVGANLLLNQGKGRGRPPPGDVPLALQRLLGGPSSAVTPDNQPQPAISAFTNVGPRKPSPKAVAATNAANMGALISQLRLDGSVQPVSGAVPSMISPPSTVAGGQNDMAMELLTPADLGAGTIDTRNVGEAIDRSLNAASFSPPVTVDRSRNQSVTSTTAQLNAGPATFNIQQFRQSLVYLLEHDQNFVQALYQAFVGASGGNIGQDSSGLNNPWRKN